MDADREVVFDFACRLYGMFLVVLSARLLRESLTKTARGGACSPITRSSGSWAHFPGHRRSRQSRLSRGLPWGWLVELRNDLLRWTGCLQWCQQPGEVSFAQIALDFEEYPSLPRNFKHTFSSVSKQAESTQIGSRRKWRLFLHVAPCACVRKLTSSHLAIQVPFWHNLDTSRETPQLDHMGKTLLALPD